MKTKVRWLVAALGVSAAGGAWLVAQGGGEAKRPAPPPEVTGPVTPVAVAPAPVSRTQCRFEVGSSLSYAVTLASESRQEAPGLGAAAEVPLDLQGALSVQVLSVRPGSSTLVGRLSLAARAGKPGIDTAAFEAAPFLVTVDEACQLQAFARWRRAEASLARNQQALLWETTFRLGTGELGVEDASGVTRAKVASRGDLVQRRLDGYQQLWVGEPSDLSVSGELNVALGQGPWFESLESRRLQLANRLSNASTLTMTRQDRPVSFAAAERDEANYVWGDLLPRQPKLELVARPFNRFDRERQDRVREQTVDQALDAFVERVKSGVGVQSRWPDLAAYFEVHPESLKPAYAKYEQGALPPGAAGDFFLALGKTRNDEARELLLSIKRNDDAVMMDQVRSMFALVTRTDVGPELAQELATDVKRYAGRKTEAADFVGGETMLALSTMSGLRSDEAIAHTTRQALSDVLAAEGPNSAIARTALKAIGNTGDPTMLQLVAPFTQHPDITTRKAAANAFSRMPPEVADPIEVEWLKRETSPFVKKELYRVLQQQHFDLQQGASRALVAQALSELPTTKSAYVRKSMIFLVAQSSVAKEPEIRRALIEQAKRERAKHTPVVNQFGLILTPEERLEVLR